MAAWSALAQVESRFVFIGSGRAEEAHRATERAVQLAPGSVEAQLASGFYEYYARRDYDAALESFRTAERLAPSNSEAAWAVGLILRRQGEWDESTRMMKRAVELDPRNVLRLETLAENVRYMGAFRDADRVVERQLAIDPASPRARARKVGLLVELDGSTGRAWRLADELGLDPTDFNEGFELIRLAYLDEDHARALELSRQVDSRGVPFLEFFLLWTRTWTLHRMGDPTAAAVADSLLDKLDPSALLEPYILIGRAMAYTAMGRLEEARREWRTLDWLSRQWTDHLNDPQFGASAVFGYGLVDELDAGFDLLKELVERLSPDLSSTNLRLFPGYAPYRDDPRFDDILRRREAFEAEGAKRGEAGRPWLP